jgi:TatD DNase family protein
MGLVDTHCHLDFETFNDDRDEVLQRAHQAGIIKIVNPGIDIENCQAIMRLCEIYTEIHTAVGVHPNSALTWTQETLGTLRNFACQPKVVAIGEIGLDFYRNRAPKELQRRIFCEQLSLASELGLPVIVHSRLAEIEVLDILSGWVVNRGNTSTPPGVLHSFGGDETIAYRAISMGLLIGITGPVTFKNAVQLQNLVIELPLSSLLIETDAPFLTPHPYRGKRNEPAYVRLVAEKIAMLKGKPVDQIIEDTTVNAARLFNWSIA